MLTYSEISDLVKLIGIESRDSLLASFPISVFRNWIAFLEKIKTFAVGDNYNDLDMLKNCDAPCLVFNDQFKLDQINIDNLIFSNKPSPEGWADVIKKALAKLKYNV